MPREAKTVVLLIRGFGGRFHGGASVLTWSYATPGLADESLIRLMLDLGDIEDLKGDYGLGVGASRLPDGPIASAVQLLVQCPRANSLPS